MKEIELFVPYKFEKRPLYVNLINRMFKSKAMYVSKGRYAILHILWSHGVRSGKVGISAYMCPSVREVLVKYGYDVTFYDIDKSDLNANIFDVKRLIDEEKVKAVVIASMYGNPADLTIIEKICRENRVLMIDDAAQSFGAKVDERFVGSFGDGGFFSFSPGKPTSAHRGGYFWSSKRYTIKRTRHFLYAIVTYKNFKYRRYLAYENHGINKNIWRIATFFVSKLPIDIINDKPERFEKYILGGVIDANIDEAREYRTYWHNIFSGINLSAGCRLISNLRGVPNNCKIVYLFEEKEFRSHFIKFLNEKDIAYYLGYSIPQEAGHLVNVNSVSDRIVELPIDSRKEKMQYMCDCISGFFATWEDKQ